MGKKATGKVRIIENNIVNECKRNQQINEPFSIKNRYNSRKRFIMKKIFLLLLLIFSLAVPVFAKTLTVDYCDGVAYRVGFDLIEYDSDKKIRYVGKYRVDYGSDKRISYIGKERVEYGSDKKVSYIGKKRVEYDSDKKISYIGNIRIEYHSGEITDIDERIFYCLPILFNQFIEQQ
jgi:hypothetical protein